MWFGVVTLFPEMFSVVTEQGVTGRAVQQGLIQVNCWNPRDYTTDRHHTVDDRPYGGGPGMVMKVAPLQAAITAAKEASGANDTPVVYLSPQGQSLGHAKVCELAAKPRLILVAGRYEGVDERILQSCVDEELSVGDYVLTGGELPAMVVIDAVSRFVPGVLGDESSATADSFASGLLDHPHYTRPPALDGQPVPAVLLSGDHAAIARWRLKQAIGRTWLRRPDLLAQQPLNTEQQALLAEFQREYHELFIGRRAWANERSN
jgi:tRNA (guanine37-N1)-methyltransferase